MATPTSTTIPTEPTGSIPRPLDLIKRLAKGNSEDLLTSLLSMRIRFERPLRGLKPRALRSLRTANRGSIVPGRQLTFN